jgi:hypothetical protein
MAESEESMVVGEWVQNSARRNLEVSSGIRKGVRVGSGAGRLGRIVTSVECIFIHLHNCNPYFPFPTYRSS